jgi:hypothetical protein
MAGHLEVTFHGQNIAEIHRLLFCKSCIHSLSYNENNVFLRNSTASHLKTLPVRKQLTFEFSAINAIWFTYFSWCGKNYFVIQCCHKLVICNLKHLLLRGTLFLSNILIFHCVYFKKHISISFMYEDHKVSSYWVFLNLICSFHSTLHVFYLPVYCIYLFIYFHFSYCLSNLEYT